MCFDTGRKMHILVATSMSTDEKTNIQVFADENKAIAVADKLNKITPGMTYDVEGHDVTF